MCGYAGLVGPAQAADFSAAMKALRNRGPDSFGEYSDSNVRLVHSRLSVQDLSDAGSQPMVSNCKRYVLVYNGEIYNFKELAEKFRLTSRLKGKSDSEVLLLLCTLLGPEMVLPQLSGMFSFCFIDLVNKSGVLARDRFGQKPLYYSVKGNRLGFGSTLDAVVCIMDDCSASNNIFNNAALNEYLSFGFVPGPNTAREGIFQLERQQYLTFSYGRELIEWVKQPYVIKEPFFRIDSEDRADVGEMLSESVRRCLVSDAPVGLFLSGGIDSSLVASYASQNLDLASFCVGFKDAEYDESKYACSVAERLGLEHHTHYVSDDELEEFAYSLPIIFGEPFADPAILPLLALSRFASKRVKVALTGDGGDELFYGYNRYAYIHALSKWMWLAGLGNALLNSHSMSSFASRLVSVVGWKAGGEKVEKLASILSQGESLDYRSFFSVLTPSTGDPVAFSDLEQLRSLDIDLFQASGTLVKSDRCSMYSGLELRSPFLEGPVADFGLLSTGPDTEIKRFTGKQTLRRLAFERIGRDLLERPKAGFTPPLMAWLSGPLRAWCFDGIEAFNSSELPTSASINIKALDKIQGHNDALKAWRIAVLGHYIDHVKYG